jgi:hypothetical protein
VLRDDWLSPLCRDRITQTGLIQSFFFFKFLFKLKNISPSAKGIKNKSFAVDMKWIKKGSLLFLKKNDSLLCVLLTIINKRKNSLYRFPPPTPLSTSYPPPLVIMLNQFNNSFLSLSLVLLTRLN